MTYEAFWNEPLTEDEKAALFATICDWTDKRGLHTPLLLALETHRPLAFVAAQGLIALTPMFAPLLGIQRMQTLNRLLTDPVAIDELIVQIGNKENSVGKGEEA